MMRRQRSIRRVLLVCACSFWRSLRVWGQGVFSLTSCKTSSVFALYRLLLVLFLAVCPADPLALTAEGGVGNPAAHTAAKDTVFVFYLYSSFVNDAFPATSLHWSRYLQKLCYSVL